MGALPFKQNKLGEALGQYKPKTLVGSKLQQAIVSQGPKSQLGALLDRELVFVDVEAQSPEELFRQLEAPLFEAGCICEGWLDAIVAREKDFPTGLDFGHVSVAIPHTDTKFVVRPYVCVVRPKEPVAFCTMGQKDVPIAAELVFNLGITQKESQVGILQELIGVCMEAQLVEQLRGARGADELTQALAAYLV